MNTQILKYEDFVNLILSAINAAGIEYLIGGAVAAWAWGEPRATVDLDLVVNIPLESINLLSDELKKRDMLVPSDIILDNLLETRVDLPIQAIHMFSGYKADLYPLRRGDELREYALRRKMLIDFGEPLGEVYVHSPEDLIIYKLWYYSLSQQTKHIRDISAIVLSLRDDLELSYIENWTNKKGLIRLWEGLFQEIQKKRGN